MLVILLGLNVLIPVDWLFVWRILMLSDLNTVSALQGFNVCVCVFVHLNQVLAKQ